MDTLLARAVRRLTSRRPSSRSRRRIDALALAAVALAALLVTVRNLHGRDDARHILNVSYDPTRELYRDVDEAFAASYRKQTGTAVTIGQSHGGSTQQARAVIDDVPADVVTLALPSDIALLSDHGLVSKGWPDRLPNGSVPYISTIVLVVRRGNPRGVHDFADLARSDETIVTPDPETSGNGKLSFLAVWGSVIRRGGTDADARRLVTALYRHTAVLERAAHDAAIDFVDLGIGDVQMAWENEALREVSAAHDELEIVYPPASIRAEPCVAWVDANVARNGTEALARAYLGFLFTEAGQEIISRHGYRPILPEVLARHASRFPEIDLFPVTILAKDWNDANQEFFSADGIFHSIYQARKQR